jgi:hypothetical protein
MVADARRMTAERTEDAKLRAIAEAGDCMSIPSSLRQREADGRLEPHPD